ncbi:hypothetical protein GWN26_02385, partial [Candidatus Saccharibacteria bacterium]|nr:hypothetical protein [Candidatus Saccharibacteria bacterium]
MVRDEKLVQSGWRLSKEMALLNASQATATIAPVTLALNESSKLSDFGKKLVEIGFIFSPLAGSQRLRNKLNLNISEKDLLAALKFILEKGWQNIRFKFMIGLPTESEQDLREIANLMEKCTETAQPFSDVQISVSVQIFSPTPHTPFQWESAESMDTLSPKVALLTEQLQKLSLNFNIQDPFTSNLKTVFQRGGRELAAVVEYAWQSGVRFDGSEETSNKALWQQAFRQKGVTIDDYLAPISITVRLPWEHIDFGFSKAFLKEEKQLAYQGKLHPNNKSIVTIGDGFSEG